MMTMFDNTDKIDNTDKTVAAAAGVTLVCFLMNTKVASVVIVYLNVLVVFGLLGYSIWRFDSLRTLRRSLITGAIAGVAYLPMDMLLSNSKLMGIITYLRHEDYLLLGVTPLSIVFSWMYLITIALYLYQRLRSLFQRAYIPMLLISLAAFCGSIILGILGNDNLWLWGAKINFPPPPPYINTMPLFVPIALALAFLFSPYFIPKTPSMRYSEIAGGIRCGIVLGIIQFLCFLLFRVFST